MSVGPEPVSTTAPAAPLTFTLTIFTDLTGTTLTTEQFTLASLAQRIRDTRAEKREDQPLLSACRFGNTRTDRGSLRHNGNVLGFNAVIVDYDRGGPWQLIKLIVQKLIEANVSFLLHTTGRSRLDAVRFRLIFPLGTEHAPDEHPQLVEMANFLFCGEAAPESGVLSQGWFFGRVKGVDFEIHYRDGTPLDLLMGLGRRPLDRGRPNDRAQNDSHGSNLPPGGLGAPNVIPLAAALGPRPAYLPPGDLAINAAASSNWSTPFNDLTPDARNALLQTILELQEVIAIADQSRPEWLKVLFALADARHRGATAAYDLALTWSKTSKRFISEVDFDRDWRSFRADRPGGITVGTLLKLAQDAGFDLSGWVAHLGSAGGPPPPGGMGGSAPSSNPRTATGGSTASAGGSGAQSGSAGARGSGGGATAGPAGATQSTSTPLNAAASAPHAAGTNFVLPPRFSENELALRFSAQHSTDLVYVHEWGKWMRWERGRWREDHAVTVFTEARKICAEEGAIALSTLPPSTAAKVAATINKASCVAAIERLARHHPPQVRSSEMFDADPLALNGPGTIAAL